MPRPRFDKLSPERQEAILHAAANEFAANGFDGASYNHIIEAAGISKGAAYYYFDDKEDLYLTVMGHVLEDFTRDVPLPSPEGIRTPKQFWAGVEAFTAEVLRYALEHPTVLGLIRSLPRASSATLRSAAMEQMGAFGRAYMEQLLRTGQSVGAVRTDIPFELLLRLLRAVDEVADTWLAEQETPLDDAALGAHATLFMDLIRRMTAPASPGKSGPAKKAG
jgi:AcrR family transcriptional regulator